MRIYLVIIFLFTGCLHTCAQDAAAVCNRINRLNTAILNGAIKKADAAAKLKELMAELKSCYRSNADDGWIFPLKGYNYKAIGGVKGNGYDARGYNYLDGNKHAAHPAHDIFIADKNQDGIDDHTRQPVDVLAVSDGIVIACCNIWDPRSLLRGGKYIWLYHPAQNILSYYAHNSAIFVKPGDVIKQGQKIAQVGRTGFNAYKKRSPTHLHFSAFRIINGLPVPYNPYHQLIKASEL